MIHEIMVSHYNVEDTLDALKTIKKNNGKRPGAIDYLIMVFDMNVKPK